MTRIAHWNIEISGSLFMLFGSSKSPTYTCTYDAWTIDNSLCPEDIGMRTFIDLFGLLHVHRSLLALQHSIILSVLHAGYRASSICLIKSPPLGCLLFHHGLAYLIF